jgi:hypothetical protein
MFNVKTDRPQWQAIYERLKDMRIGEVITDDDLYLVLPDAPQGSVRTAFWRARRQMQEDHKRSFERVRRVGYRMVDPAEHERLAKAQHKKAKRRLKAGWREAHSADRSLLTPDERRRIDAIEDHLARHQQMIRRLEERQVRTDERVAATEKGSVHLSDRLDQLTALLQRHGITND